MSPNWSLLVPGLIVGIVTGVTIGGTIDVGRRLAEFRSRRRSFDAQAPGALAAAHDVLVAGIPRDPSWLIPSDPFVRAVREQMHALQVGSQAAKAQWPAIAMLDGLDRLLEEMTVRGRALDAELTLAIAEGRVEAETRFMLKLTRQAIQRDPAPATPVPAIDNQVVTALLAGRADLTARIVQYRELQERLYAVAEQFVEHWWVVRELRLDASARIATSALTGGPVARWRSARAIERDLHAQVVADFRPRWEALTAHLG